MSSRSSSRTVRSEEEAGPKNVRRLDVSNEQQQQKQTCSSPALIASTTTSLHSGSSSSSLSSSFARPKNLEHDDTSFYPDPLSYAATRPSTIPVTPLVPPSALPSSSTASRQQIMSRQSQPRSPSHTSTPASHPNTLYSHVHSIGNSQPRATGLVKEASVSTVTSQVAEANLSITIPSN